MTTQPSTGLPTNDRPKKPWYLRWWVWVIAGVVVIGGIGQALTGDEAPADTPAAENSEAVTPTPEAEEAAVEEESAPTTTPADAEALWLSMHGVSDPIEFTTMEGYSNDLSNPLYAIQTGWEGSTSGYLEIKVQESLDRESVKRLGINVLNFIGPEFPDVKGVVFTDASGRDWNFYRADAPLANG